MTNQGGAVADQAGDVAGDVEAEMQAAHFVQRHHVEGGGGGAFLEVAADVKAFIGGAAMQQVVHNARVAMKGEEYRGAGGEVTNKIFVAEAVRVQGLRAEANEVDNVDNPYTQIRQEAGHQPGARD